MYDNNDEVGYGKPPKEHQYKKGKSGNPKGRPKGWGKSGVQKLNLIIADELAETIVISENGCKKSA